MIFQRLAGVKFRTWFAISAVAALAVASTALAAPSGAHDPKPTVKPTIVLVHGAWAGSSSWDGVISRLQHDGYTVDAPPYPLQGLSNDSAYMKSYLSTISGPVVLVGHSYGGAVISEAAAGNPNVKALVYVDAYIPDVGETVAGLTGSKPGSALAVAPQDVFDFVPYPGAPSGDADLYVKASVFRTAFANGLSSSQAAVLAATQSPVVASALKEPATAAAWKTIRSWSVIGTADHVIPPAEQEFMAARAHASVTKIDAGHLSMISHPEAVTGVILQAAKAAG
jgi:pimeloyl-ACP methyl ester carboxylesterase